MSSLKYWFWLAERQGIGLVRAKALIEYFGSAERVYNAEYSEYLDVDGIKPSDIKKLMQKELGTANKILSACAETGCKIITLNDSNYPECLRNIYDPPLILYMKGNLPYIDDEPVVGVVGTRKCTPYGITTAENVGYELSKNGIIVVTGLAKGVDTAATRGALRGSSDVIGVIGSGLDIVYPPENKDIYEDVARNGVVISEYPPGTPPLPANFPARNRIISGLSRGVAVIEAPKKSGALITAARALEQGRDVFTLPGNVDAVSCAGSNALLREGAIPFLSASDIIEEYTLLYPEKMSVQEKPKQKISFDNTSKVDYIDLGNLLGLLEDDEKTIVKSIGQNTLLVDEIIIGTGFPARKVLSSLTILELNGYVNRDNSGRWKILNQS
jgi:DNA processing protein